MMKYLYLDYYINYYQDGHLLDCRRVDREPIPDLETGKRLLQGKHPKAIENKNFISVYEAYKITYKEDATYKILFKEATADGVLSNV